MSIQIKRSTTPGKVPTSLMAGELAINQADGILYWADSNNVIQSMPLFSAPIDGLVSNNLIVNGGMEVSQQFAQTPQTVGANVALYIADQFTASTNTSSGAFSAYQSVTTGAAPGFNAYMALKATTGMATLSSTNYVAIIQPIEGYRWSKLGYGTSFASPCTLSFWVYSVAATVGAVSIRNGAGRSYVKDYNVPAGAWTYISLSIPGDQSGTWQTTNAIGAYITWCFGSGASYQGASGQWLGGNFFATANTTNALSTTNNYVGLTGVSLVPGALSVPAGHAFQLIPPFDRTMRDCMRYYEVGVEPLTYRNSPTSGITYAYDTLRFTVPKRAIPSMSFSNWSYYSAGTPAFFTPTINVIDINRVEVLGQNLSNWMGWYNSGTWAANARM